MGRRRATPPPPLEVIEGQAGAEVKHIRELQDALRKLAQDEDSAEIQRLFKQLEAIRSVLGRTEWYLDKAMARAGNDLLQVVKTLKPLPREEGKRIIDDLKAERATLMRAFSRSTGMIPRELDRVEEQKKVLETLKRRGVVRKGTEEELQNYVDKLVAKLDNLIQWAEGAITTAQEAERIAKAA